MTIFHLDLETRSRVDVEEAGVLSHVHDQDFAIISAALKKDSGPTENIPVGALPALPWDDLSISWYAFNAPFEMTCLARVGVPIHPDRWTCVMSHAYARGFTGSLRKVGEQLGIEESLLKSDGSRLIAKFSAPRQPSRDNPDSWWTEATAPDDWQDFLAYNRQDVEAEAAIAERLDRYPLTPAELDLMRWDWRINLNGLPIDADFARKAVDLIPRYTDDYLDEIREITGASNPNSRNQILEWIRAWWLPLPDLRQQTVENLLRDPGIHPTLRRVLELRLAVSQAATKKYQGVLDRLHDGRFHWGFQLNGAGRTGRWAHRGLQPGNLKRPLKEAPPDMVAEAVVGGTFDALYGGWDRELEILGSSIRAVIKASPGKRLVVSDLSSIETRLLGYYAQADALNQVFAEGSDPYIRFASNWFSLPYEAVTKEQRQLAKPPVLGCGYMLGAIGLRSYAESMGIEMMEPEAKAAVTHYREWVPEVVAYWARTETAVADAVMGMSTRANGFLWFRQGEFLVCRLPSGRRLWYQHPKWELVETPWGEMKYGFTYMGQHQKTGKWVRLTAHSGKLVENQIQAVARDILAHGMRLYDEAGGFIVGHVHDEVIAEESEDRLELLNKCLSVTPDWAPGLILEAEGYVAERFRKG